MYSPQNGSVHGVYHSALEAGLNFDNDTMRIIKIPSTRSRDDRKRNSQEYRRNQKLGFTLMLIKYNMARSEP